MATAMSLSIHEILQCNICQETMTDPKMLYCQHSFCSHCLEKWQEMANHRQGAAIRKLSCPTCRSVTKLPAGGVSHLKSDLTQKKLADVLTEPKDPVCEVCIESATVLTQRRACHFCRDCSTYMCTTCTETHTNIKLFNEHSLLTVVEKGFCQQHPPKRKDFYCEKCDMLVCILCVIHGHQMHQDSLHDARKYSEDKAMQLKELKSQLIKVNQVPDHLKDIFEDQLHGLKKINENITRLQEQVSKLADSAINYIEAKRNMIQRSLEKATDAVTSAEIWADRAETLKLQVENLLQKYNTYLQTEQPTDFPQGFKELNEKVETRIIMFSSDTSALEPNQLPGKYLEYEEYLSKCEKVFAVGLPDNSTDKSDPRYIEFDWNFQRGEFYDEYVDVDDYDGHDDNDLDQQPRPLPLKPIWDVTCVPKIPK